MRFEDMTPEMVEEAKGCETPEERMAFIRENGVELTDEQLEGISGGAKKTNGGSGGKCPKSDSGHKWKWTGRMVPATIWRNIWPDYEIRCVNCGAISQDWIKH